MANAQSQPDALALADSVRFAIQHRDEVIARWERWSRLDRAEDSFAEFNLESTKTRHKMADMDKTCDFQTLHHDRKCLIAEVERLRTALEEIDVWCRAYPRTVFIEPTDEQWAEANRVLDEAGGCSLTAISGSNMRHVVEGISGIANKALNPDD